MQIKFTKDLLVKVARERTEAGRPPFGPTGLEVRAFLNLCAGKGDEISVQVDDAHGFRTAREVEDVILDEVVAPRVSPYPGMGAFVAARLHDELETLRSETGHGEHSVVGFSCHDNNGVLHLMMCTRNGRMGTLHESRSRWNVTFGKGVAVKCDDLLVDDCLKSGGLDLPLTRWFAGAYPKGDYCTISNIAAYGKEAAE